MLMQLEHERNLKLDAFERVEELQRTVRILSKENVNEWCS